jgi:hypothetical protein
MNGHGISVEMEAVNRRRINYDEALKRKWIRSREITSGLLQRIGIIARVHKSNMAFLFMQQIRRIFKNKKCNIGLTKCNLSNPQQ